MHKHLTIGLLSNIHSEAKIFEILNNSLKPITKSKHSEVLLFDKVHRILYGYPLISANGTRNLRDFPETFFNKTQLLAEKENIKDFQYATNSSIDLPFTFNDDLHVPKRQEIKIEDESLVKYCVLHKEIINSASVHHLNIWNKMLDCPFLLLKSGLGQSQFHKTKIPKLMYFPLCNNLKEVVGIIRVFPDSDEVLDSDIIDQLTR